MGSDRKGGLCVSMRKHGLDVVHAEYRRDSFHCEHALQSLVEIEGENMSGNPPSPPDQTPDYIPGTDAMRKTSQLMKQDVKTVLTTTTDTANVKANLSDPVKSTEKDKGLTKSENTVAINSGGKEASRDVGKSQSFGTDTSGKTTDHTPMCQTTGGQETKPEISERSKDAGKTSLLQTTSPETSKSCKLSQKAEVNVTGPTSVTPKVSGPQVLETGLAQSKSTEPKVQTPTRCPQEDRRQETPASPSPTARSPSASKSRAGSPGDRSSFVTQLTSVAKTVLGPMKLGSQDSGKGKDGGSKSNEDKRAATLGKSEASSGSRRGLTGTWPGPGSSKAEKSSKSSSKHL